MIIIFVFENCHNLFSWVPPFGSFWSAKYLNFGGESCEIKTLPSLIQETFTLNKIKKVLFFMELRTKFTWSHGLIISKPIANMKAGKAKGPSGSVIAMIRLAGKIIIISISQLSNCIINGGWIPSRSYIVSLYNDKGDSLSKGNYRGLKLLDKVLKIIKKYSKQRSDLRLTLTAYSLDLF